MTLSIHDKLSEAKATRDEAHRAAWAAEANYGRAPSPDTLAQKIEAWRALRHAARALSDLRDALKGAAT